MCLNLPGEFLELGKEKKEVTLNGETEKYIFLMVDVVLLVHFLGVLYHLKPDLVMIVIFLRGNGLIL